ncbi:MAG: NADH-quinone oxidoreductase subunit M [Lawsonella sp.]
MYLLTSAALVPLAVALLLTVVRGVAARVLAMLASLSSLGLAIAMAVLFEPGAGMQFVEQHRWIPQINAYYSLGVDGIGLSLVLLTTILTPLVILYTFTENFREDQMGERAFLGLVLAVEGLSLFVFSATDVLLFYLFFEATLIPMFFLIGGFGGARKRYAAIKFLLYSLSSGLIMLAAVIGVYVNAQAQGNGTFLLSDLLNMEVGTSTGRLLFVGFMIAFAVKAPMVPVHTWLPDAAENTTPGGAVMMVAIMDKIGTFGMLRFALGLFPEAAEWATPVVVVLAVISVIYGALAALAQDNLMRLVAYTSVSHFGFIVLGIFALTPTSVAGSTLYMFNHGISTAALFLLVGYMIKRRGSADISDFGGVQKVAPVMAGFLLVAGLSALSLPGLAPFVSEFGVIVGTWPVFPWAAGISAIGMVLAALYIMRLYRQTMTGEPNEVVQEKMTELTMLERIVIIPLLALLLVFGIYPAPLTNILNPDSEQAVTHVEQAVNASDNNTSVGVDAK